MPGSAVMKVNAFGSWMPKENRKSSKTIVIFYNLFIIYHKWISNNAVVKCHVLQDSALVFVFLQFSGVDEYPSPSVVLLNNQQLQLSCSVSVYDLSITVEHEKISVRRANVTFTSLGINMQHFPNNVSIWCLTSQSDYSRL